MHGDDENADARHARCDESVTALRALRRGRTVDLDHEVAVRHAAVHPDPRLPDRAP
jgi:alkanesulfonate monooxygenase SsuD/methylene tetrahydromethanopterin reductase-like flavin-dependent oxidoreductase (luciferase family)